MTVLKVSGLCKSYSGFELKNVALSLEKGRIMGFIGRNGAGKTTTMKSLVNFIHPDAGRIEFFGLSFAVHEREIKERIGFVSGGTEFYPHSKLRAITDVSRAFYRNWDEKSYRENLKRFSLDENKTPAQLSAGMKVKYALTLALSHHAELLLLDEPTSGLDPVSRDDLLDEFLHLSRDEEISILFSTHITSDLDKCADDISYLRAGRIAGSGMLEDFVKAYRTVSFDDAELKEEQKKLLIGIKRAKHGQTALVRLDDVEKLGVETQPADLENIMIHLEREGEEC